MNWVNCLKSILTNYFSLGSSESKFSRNGWKRKLSASVFLKRLLVRFSSESIQELSTVFPSGINSE